MENFKKSLRLIWLCILIVLACFGVGISGGATVPVIKRRDNITEVKIELVEVKDRENDIGEFKDIKD